MLMLTREPDYRVNGIVIHQTQRVTVCIVAHSAVLEDGGLFSDLGFGRSLKK